MTLQLKHISVAVEGKEIIQDLSLAIEKGETHVIMGPNGAGKSTLVHAIGGHPTYTVSGEMMMGGERIVGMSPDERAKQGLFVSLQQQIPIPGLSIANFLRLAYQATTGEQLNPLAFHNTLVEHCEGLGIDPVVLKRSINVDFSGGEKKQIELLQLQVLNPSVAVLDETDSGLDIDAVKTVGKGIAAFQNGTKSILLVTHYNRLPAFLDVTQVHVMMKGKIVKTGGPELAAEIEEHGYETYG